MFGYIECNRSKLSKEEQERYRSVYCGLCRNLKLRYGELERMSLSYDMTFVILFLSSLYSAVVSIPCVREAAWKTGLRNTRRI